MSLLFLLVYFCQLETPCSLSDSVEGALDVVAESYILEGMREQLFEWCANGEETNPPGSGHEASTERADTETKEEENVSENAEGSR